jgi:transcriptional regulator with XRE-family HTH domain
MDPLTRAREDFEALADDLRRHGVDLESVFDDLVGENERQRLLKLYEEGREGDGRDLLRTLMESHVKAQVVDARQAVERLTEEVKAKEQALSTWKDEQDADNALDFTFGFNVSIVRRLFGLSKAALARRVDISRPTLIKIENGNGARLGVMEELADAFNVAPSILLLGSRKVGVLFDAVHITDPLQELLHEVLDEPNEAATYVRHLSRKDRSDTETLRVVGDVLESVDDRYDSPGARGGAAVGWMWGLPPEHAPQVTDRVTRGLMAAVVAGWWGFELTGPGHG